MNKFKKKSLYLAVAAGLGAVGLAGSAAAVNVNSNGLGQYLIYPYYTVRNGTDTYISLTNTSSFPKAVKVRFTEGKNSREVLDFNLYLSPYDMWTGALTATATGAMLITKDTSCTYPAIPAAGQAFVNYAYSGANPPAGGGFETSGGDGGDQSLDRTREGYFEIIEMGTITDSAVAAAVLHSSGIPANCAYVQQPQGTMDMSPSGNHPLSAASGGLEGNATLINVAEGTDYGYDPVALDNFTSATYRPQGIWAPASTIYPNATNADPNSTVFDNNKVVQTYWPTTGYRYGGVDAVSAVLMHDNVMNDYVLDAATLSGTDWVVTMPTKHWYVPIQEPASNISYSALQPFTTNFWNGACEKVDVSYWDREEQLIQNVSFSPPPPTQYNSLCWESTVVTFNDSNVLGSTNALTFL